MTPFYQSVLAAVRREFPEESEAKTAILALIIVRERAEDMSEMKGGEDAHKVSREAFLQGFSGDDAGANSGMSTKSICESDFGIEFKRFF